MSDENGSANEVEAAAGDLSYRYTLVLGPDGADRAFVEGVLIQSGIEVAASIERDLTPDVVPPALVLLDDSGGKAERMEAFRRLRHHPALVGVPVVVLAYDADIDSYTAAITKGAAAYLVKPVNADELVAAVRKISGWMHETDRTEKRRRLRRPLLMKVDVEIRSRHVKVPGQIIDVSGGGCRVELHEALELGEHVRVVLHGHESTTHVTLGGEVRWRRPSADDPALQVCGLKFTGTTALLAGKILGFVSTGTT
ncbi:MAG TPA: PilZ domain-containing protein [Vicinamibacteria bacterium]